LVLYIIELLVHIWFINSEQAGRPRSSRQWRMNDWMIRE